MTALPMITLTTSGITISVYSMYSEEHSDPIDAHYMFLYDVCITNTNLFPVQLISREWHVFDSCNEKRCYEGEGVIGVQPIIDAGTSYRYQSACNLFTPRGEMRGLYIMSDLKNESNFEVQIPKFRLELPYLNN